MRNSISRDSDFDASTTPSESLVPFPFEITFVDGVPMPIVQGLVEEHLVRLSHHCDRITHAHVFLRVPHKHRHDRQYHVHLQLDVPGKRLVVSRDPDVSDKHADIKFALRDAFHKISRQLEDFVKSRPAHKHRPHHSVA